MSAVEAMRDAADVLRRWVDWCDFPDGGDVDTNELRDLSAKAAAALIAVGVQRQGPTTP